MLKKKKKKKQFLCTLLILYSFAITATTRIGIWCNCIQQLHRAIHPSLLQIIFLLLILLLFYFSSFFILNNWDLKLLILTWSPSQPPKSINNYYNFWGWSCWDLSAPKTGSSVIEYWSNQDSGVRKVRLLSLRLLKQIHVGLTLMFECDFQDWSVARAS